MPGNIECNSQTQASEPTALHSHLGHLARSGRSESAFYFEIVRIWGPALHNTRGVATDSSQDSLSLGLPPTGCILGLSSLWEYMRLNSLIYEMKKNRFFIPDLKVIDYLFTELVNPERFAENLLELVQQMLKPKVANSRAIDIVLRWAEAKTLQLIEALRDSDEHMFHLFGTLSVLGARFVLPNQSNDDVQQARQSCASLLQELENPFSLLPDNNSDEILVKNPLLWAILEGSNWSSGSISTQLARCIADSPSGLWTLLSHRCFNPDIQTDSVDIPFAALMLSKLLDSELYFAKSTDLDLLSKSLDFLLRICVEKEISIIPCPTQLSYPMFRLLYSDTNRISQLACRLDSPLALFQSPLHFIEDNEIVFDRDYKLFQLEVLCQLYEEWAAVAPNDRRSEELRMEYAFHAWKAIFQYHFWFRNADMEVLVHFIEPVIRTFPNEHRQLLARVVQSSESALETYGSAFDLLVERCSDVDVLREAILSCFKARLGIDLSLLSEHSEEVKEDLTTTDPIDIPTSAPQANRTAQAQEARSALLAVVAVAVAGLAALAWRSTRA